MRRETDFILEQAPWPALLLEETGGICRANRAASQVFGPAVQSPLSPFAGFWAKENTMTLGKFIDQPSGGNCQIKLLVNGGQKGDFFAHLARISRDGQSYFLLQLFKETGTPFPDLPALALPLVPQKMVVPQPQIAQPPPLPVKAVPEEAVFPLDNSPWPAFLVQKNGMIQKANPTAVQNFGASVSKTDTQFAFLWLPNNSVSAADFLQSGQGSGLQASFRVKTGNASVFLAHACPATDKNCILVQLFASASTGSAQPGAPAASSTGVPPATETSTATGIAPGDTTFAYKQKLDCAMQLARSISLDLNNALTSILGHTSLVLSKVEANYTWRTSLVEIEKSASRAAEIANDLAVFSRQEKESRTQSGGNINSLLERAIDAVKADHGTVTWSPQFERKLCTSTVDEAKIQQAFIKVLENAAQACSSNGRVNIQTRNMELTEPTQDRTARLAAGSYVCIEITDSGQGIAADVMPHIFEPFFTTKGKNHRGLGLAWVYGIVTNHAGGVAVSSQAGAGTSVRVYLPANKRLIKDTPVVGDDLSGTQTVLFVDDEDLLLTMGQMVLSSFGYTVLTANGGKKALEILKQAKKPINLMITDLVMPGMSGRELTEQVQQLSPETRILWSSGYILNDNSAKQRTYLQKPFTSQDLLRKVKEVLAE